MKNSKNNSNKYYSGKALVLISIMLFILGFLIGFVIFKTAPKSKSDDMDEVYNTLTNEYIEKINKKKLKAAAIKGMIKFIKDEYKDNYTVYYNAKDTNDFNEILSGKFYGTGAEIYKYKDDPVTISRVFENSPAEKAGLKKGDQYIKINGEDVTNKKADEISKMIKGKKKKTYEVIIKRKDEEKTFNITTDIVDIPSVDSRIIKHKNEKIGYIYISIFAGNTDEQFYKKLQDFEKKGVKKLIIDLRYDSGGDLDSVINIASNFMNQKQVIVKTVTNNNVTKKYSIKNSKNKYKIAILINRDSASGSEVLASALNENCNATLIGETTFGKGSVQRTKILSDKTMIKYTIQKWETSKGKQINKKGIKPNIEEKLQDKYFKTFKQKDDNQLQKAIEVLLN